MFYELDQLGVENCKELLSGMGEAYFRLLIICKLCNDPNYQKKFDEVAKIFDEPDEWQPYWEQYQELLDSLEPKYNCNS